MSITYVDPAAEATTPAEPYELFLDFGNQPITLGLLANAFPDAANFTDCVEAALKEHVPGVTLRRYQKLSVDPVLPDMLQDIADNCDGVVAIWGH